MKMDQPIGDKATAAMLGLPACAGGAAGGLQATGAGGAQAHRAGASLQSAYGGARYAQQKAVWLDFSFHPEREEKQ